MRPISNVVDVTNYAMLALGNPLHAFDHATLAGGRIVVRRAARGETLRTLDGVERQLDPADLVIADAERAIALAGIMGGEETEVTDATTDVLLEAANFEPYGLLRTSERLKLRTEGSNRWEKGVDPVPRSAGRGAGDGADRRAGRCALDRRHRRPRGPARSAADRGPPRARDRGGRPRARGRRASRAARADRLRASRRRTVTVPTWRARDVTREIDVVEEVARFRLDDVPFTLPLRRSMTGRLTREQRLRRLAEDVLSEPG